MERLYRIERTKHKGKFMKNLKWMKSNLSGRVKHSELVEYELREVGRVPVVEYLKNNVEVED